MLDARWLWLVAFVGVNSLQSGLTGWCLTSNLLGELVERGFGDAAGTIEPPRLEPCAARGPGAT